jgi:flagellar basal body-associated protein FliL
MTKGFKGVLIIGIILVCCVAGWVIATYFTKQTDVVPSNRQNAVDSLEYYLQEQNKKDIESKIAGDSAIYYANKLKVLDKTLADNGPLAQLKRKELRTAIQDTNLARYVRDSLRGQHP